MKGAVYTSPAEAQAANLPTLYRPFDLMAVCEKDFFEFVVQCCRDEFSSAANSMENTAPLSEADKVWCDEMVQKFDGARANHPELKAVGGCPARVSRDKFCSHADTEAKLSMLSSKDAVNFKGPWNVDWPLLYRETTDADLLKITDSLVRVTFPVVLDADQCTKVRAGLQKMCCIQDPMSFTDLEKRLCNSIATSYNKLEATTADATCPPLVFKEVCGNDNLSLSSTDESLGPEDSTDGPPQGLASSNAAGAAEEAGCC
ncbi:unnamed protein product [Amoebophrya sp. A120]|nr:unnamed protein product [Amoebophrya sp. A120]|eukprot:GSA120T00019467001.1